MRGCAAIALSAGLLAGCTAVQYPVPPLPARAEAPEYYTPPVEQEYRLQTGDTLSIRSYFDAQLNQDAIVRPDGRISLLLIGELQVVGLTPTELAARIREPYTRLVGRTDVAVAVVKSAGASIYLTGELKSPALVPLEGNTTLLQAVARVGGFLATANTGYVLLIRNKEDGTLAVRQIDVEKILRGESSDVYLQRRDVVYVPKSDIAQINQFVDQYINNIVPHAVQIQLGWFNSRTTNRNAAVQVTPP